MTTMVTTVAGDTSVRIGVFDTARCALGVLAPMLAQGAIRRRNRIVRLAQRSGLDRRGADLLHRLRHRHGPGPLRLSVPGRSVAVVVDPADVERLLTGSPDPFAPATTEKAAALRHFQTARSVNEHALDSGRPLHRPTSSSPSSSSTATRSRSGRCFRSARARPFVRATTWCS
jgi:hypothetical protein